MRPLVQFLRFVLELQGAVVQGASLLASEEAVEVKIKRHGNAKPRCPECGAVLGGRITTHRRMWRHLDLVKTKTWLSSDIREGYCRRHGRRVESVPWAAPAANHTHRFDRAVASFVQVADKTAAARVFAISWRTAGRIVTRVVEMLMPNDRLDGLERIGVDETSYKRAHKYLTIVSNLDTGAVVWVADGKSAEVLDAFFLELGPERCARLKLIAMDMGEAYRKSAKANAPAAEIVFDKFHVVQLLLNAVDEIRRDEVRKTGGEAGKAIKGMRYAFLRNPRHTSSRDEEKIAKVSRSNRKLARAYELRVDFDDLWRCTTKEKAEEFAMNWTRAALRSRQEPLMRFARTMRKHLDGILNYFKWDRATNALLEGTNNKVKLAIHRAFGFHSVSALIATVFLICGKIQL